MPITHKHCIIYSKALPMIYFLSKNNCNGFQINNTESLVNYLQSLKENSLIAAVFLFNFTVSRLTEFPCMCQLEMAAAICCMHMYLNTRG